jgi:hypothetical protein
MTEANNGGTPSGFEVVAFFAADHAAVENGKAYVNGGFFDRVYFPVFPAPIASIAVVGLIRVSAQQFQREHQFVVELQEGDNDTPIVRLEGGFRTLPAPDAEQGEPAYWPLAIPLSGFSLPRAGNYYFVLSINGDETARYKVRAMQVGVITQMLPQTPTGGSSEQQEE